jgi:hypothetical protein
MVAVMQSVGVGASQMRGLAVLELLGAAGLFVGIWSKPIEVAAGVGLCLYFLGALVVHVRAKHSAKDLTPALIVFLLAVIVTILEFAR